MSRYLYVCLVLGRDLHTYLHKWFAIALLPLADFQNLGNTYPAKEIQLNRTKLYDVKQASNYGAALCDEPLKRKVVLHFAASSNR